MRTTWILIANSSEARLFQAQKSTKDMTLVQEFKHPESREKAIDLVADGQGRYRNMAAPKSSFQDPSNPKQVEAERFAHQLAIILDDGRNQNLYGNLVIIAPSHFQGLLNKCVNIHVKDRISSTIDKDYTKLKEHELPAYLYGKVVIRRAA
jgi:protein required for attachment to host cells